MKFRNLRLGSVNLNVANCQQKSPALESRKPTLTDRDDGVEAAVPDVDLVPAQLRHGVDLALAGEVRHLLVDVGRVGLLGEVGARSEHAHPGYLRRGSSWYQ